MSSFNSEYRKLNPQQRLAVDTIEGPVMVIAGAGTGKTQTIALRIANILKKTDTSPNSILCLTYTEVAANNMRTRLLDLIGADAYKVKIGTFHSFCNDIITNNSEYFPLSANLQPLDDLESIEIIRQIIDKLDNSSPLVTWGDRYFYQKSLQNNLNLVKREDISPKSLSKLIKDQEIFVKNAGDLIGELSQIRATKNNYPQINNILDKLVKTTQLSSNLLGHLQVLRNSSENLSEVKTKIKKFYLDLEKNIPKQNEFVNIYHSYQKALQKKSLYDYQDMILFVLKAFKDNPDLLLNYQEKYQYILVDEYQDTNSAQNNLIDLLGSYFSKPNIFVVGDDDQSIFRFQGASVENIYHFYQKYQPKKIVLKNNYRSHKLIISSSESVISYNKNRIASLISDIDKSLVSSVNYDPDPINLAVLNSNIEEDYFLAKKISDLIKSGESPNEIAVLFRKNRDPQELVKMLSAFNVKYYLASESNILESPIIIQVIKLLEFISNPNHNESLYHLLSAPFVKLNPLDLLKIIKQKVNLSDVIFDASTIKKLNITPLSQKIIIRLGQRVAITKADLYNYPLEKVFNRLLKRFRILKFLLSKDDVESLNQIHTFYKLLKETAIRSNLNLPDFLKRINLYLENKLSIPSPSINYDSGDSIKLLTVHGAKGLEFNHVFIYHLTSDSWERQRDQNKLRLPFGILKSEITKTIEDDFEEDRRLFYVALTRAKKQIYLSYSQLKENGKTQQSSVFISEIQSDLIQKVEFSDHQSALKTYYHYSQNSSDIKPDLAKYLHDYLHDSYKFNVTHLNSYLRCPLCFYYKTILKIPQSKEKFGSFGTAIHSAISQLYLQKPSLDKVLVSFDIALKLERLSKNDYGWCLQKGTDLLTNYYHQYFDSIKPDNISEYNFYSDNLVFDQIPLTGKIDLIEKQPDGKIKVIDFKTGNPDTKYQYLSPTGDYFRQLVFYKLLLDIKDDPRFKFSSGVIDFVEKSKIKNSYIRKEFEITQNHLDDLKTQIKDVYQKILNLEFFEIGPDCTDKNHLHYLLKR